MPCLACVKHSVGSSCSYTGEQFANDSEYGGKVSVFRTFPEQKPSPLNWGDSRPSDSGRTVPQAQTFNNWHSPSAQTKHSTSLNGTLQSPGQEPVVVHQPAARPAATAHVPQNGVLSELEMLKSKLHQLESLVRPEQAPAPQQNIRVPLRPLSRSYRRLDSPLHPLQLQPHQPVLQHPLHPLQLHHQQKQEVLPPIGDPADVSTYIGINPYNELRPDELVDFYDNYTPIHIGVQNRQMNFGPFSWLSFMKKDPALQLLWGFMNTHRKLFIRNVVPPVLIKDDLKELGSDSKTEVEFRRKAMDRDGDNDVAPFGKLQSEIKIALNKHAISLGLTVFEGEVDQKLHLIEQIRLMLPAQRTTWVLINRFFSVIYPFVPLVDEQWFRLEIRRLLGPEGTGTEKCTLINVEKRLDLATLGILLIMLRLSYLSTFSNNKNENERVLAANDQSELAEAKYILSNPIDIDVVKLAQLCLEQFDLHRRTSLPVLQCAVFMRIYRLFSPEEGDGSDGGDAHVFNAMCIQIAYCMGLNREPNLFKDCCNQEKTNNLGRKLWYFLRTMDMNQSLQYGFPLMIDDNYNEVLMPYYTNGNANVLDTNMEKSICESLSATETLYGRVRHILRRSLQLKNRMKMSELTELLSEFERQMQTHLGKLSDYTQPSALDEYRFVKVLRCKSYINMRSITMSLLQHFFLNYELAGLDDLAFFYLRKCISISSGELVPEFLELIRNNHKNFDSKSTIPDLVLTPSLEAVIHKTNQFNFSILSRLHYSIQKMKGDRELHNKNLMVSFEYRMHYAKICKLTKLLHKICKYNMACLSRLSSRYYYAWRICKGHLVVLDCLAANDFQEHIGSQKMKFIPFNAEQVTELLTLCDKAMWRIKCAVHAEAKDQQSNDDLEPEFTPAPDPLPIDPPRSQFEESNLRFGNAGQTHNLEPTNFKYDAPLSNPLSFDLDDFKLENTGEIDNIWLQLNSLKADVWNENNAPNAAGVNGPEESMPTDQQLPFPVEFSEFDLDNIMFSNIPT